MTSSTACPYWESFFASSSTRFWKKFKKKIVEMAAQEELNGFQRGLVLLDTIVTAAPMLGLLGTVTGIINSFNILAITSGQATTQSISQGIAEALIATATGLVIAIPTIFFLNFFQKRVESEAKKLSQYGQAVLDVIRGGEHGGTAN
jgi:biopolymer transport protein ExbB